MELSDEFVTLTLSQDTDGFSGTVVIHCLPAALSSVSASQRFVCVEHPSPSTDYPNRENPNPASAPHIETSTGEIKHATRMQDKLVKI